MWARQASGRGFGPIIWKLWCVVPLPSWLCFVGSPLALLCLHHCLIYIYPITVVVLYHPHPFGKGPDKFPTPFTPVPIGMHRISTFTCVRAFMKHVTHDCATSKTLEFQGIIYNKCIYICMCIHVDARWRRLIIEKRYVKQMSQQHIAVKSGEGYSTQL
jgi:hypothetical protein